MTGRWKIAVGRSIFTLGGLCAFAAQRVFPANAEVAVAATALCVLALYFVLRSTTGMLEAVLAAAPLVAMLCIIAQARAATAVVLCLPAALTFVIWLVRRTSAFRSTAAR